MERKLPKNIRQIGNVSDNPKVYVEDYVDTYLSQMCDRAKEIPMGAFLIGETLRKDEQDYIFIHGAVQMQDVEIRGNEVVIGDKTWKKACEEGKRFFAGNTILGWFLTAPGLQVKLNTNLIKLHERLFMRKSRMLILKDSLEKEESLFVYKYNDLMEIGGHYIYYEKNPSMQDYMIAKRKQNCVTPSESVEDRATKDFRSIIKGKEEQQKTQKFNKYTYMTSGLLVLLLIVMGVVSLNDYEKLQMVETTMVSIMSKVSGESEISEESEQQENNNIITTGNVIEENLEELSQEDSELALGEGEESEESEDGESKDGESEEKDTEDELLKEDTEEDKLEMESVNDNQEKSEEAQGDEASESVNNIYIVKAGDSLAQISKDYYGSVAKVDELCAWNNLEDEDYIYVGQELILLE